MPLRTLIYIAYLLPCAHFIWSEGLDPSTFEGVEVYCYQKDMLLGKPHGEELLIAFDTNGKPMGRKRTDQCQDVLGQIAQNCCAESHYARKERQPFYDTTLLCWQQQSSSGNFEAAGQIPPAKYTFYLVL